MSNFHNLKIIFMYLTFKDSAKISNGYSVLLGPPLPCDCSLVNGWINAGSRDEIRRHQVYQISYFCPLIGHHTVFQTHLADSAPSQLTTPISAISVVVSYEKILRGLLGYLISKGWQNVLLLHEPQSAYHANMADLMRSIPLPLIPAELQKWVVEIKHAQPIYRGLNFTKLLSKYEVYIEGKR